MTNLTANLYFADARSAGRVKLTYDRPALEGSEKQVLWANEIRAKFEKQAVEFILKSGKINEGCYLQRDDPSDIQSALDAVLARTIKGTSLAEHLSRFFAQKSAKFYIDNRNEIIETLLAKAAQ